MKRLYHDFYNHELVSKPLLRVHIPRHSPHLHKREVCPPVHKDIPGIFFLNAILPRHLLPVFFVLLDKNRSIIWIPFRKCANWIRDFFVRKEKPFDWGKVRHKIADCLESRYALPYRQFIKACVRKFAFHAPGAELSSFYKGEEFLLGVGNTVGHIRILQVTFLLQSVLFWRIESQRQGDTRTKSAG